MSAAWYCPVTLSNFVSFKTVFFINMKSYFALIFDRCRPPLIISQRAL